MLYISPLLAIKHSLPNIYVYLSGYKLGPPLLDWNTVQQKLPWGVIILLGGGFALADMCKVSSINTDGSRLLPVNAIRNVTMFT